MIGEGQFLAQLETIEQILKQLDLFISRVAFPNKSLGTAAFKGQNYREVYEKCIREFAYDFLISDQALLSFDKAGRNIHDGYLSYSYYESPSELVSYKEFVAMELEIPPENFELIESFGDDYRHEYEQYVNSAPLRDNVIPVRYDYQAKDYRPNIHPASHVHFGFGGHVRVGTRRIIEPLAFLLFILRQKYPESWRQLQNTVNFPTWCNSIRDNAVLVNRAYWCDQDNMELYLH